MNESAEKVQSYLLHARQYLENAEKLIGRRVWRGLSPKEKDRQLRKKYPDKRVGISWVTREEIVVCIRHAFCGREAEARFCEAC